MYGLNHIIKQNQDAVRAGIVKPGELIGTAHVKPKAVKVVRTSDGSVLERFADATSATTKYLHLIKTNTVQVEDDE